MYGVKKSPETLAKITKLIYVYNLNDDHKLIGSYGTVECTRVFKIGHSTLLKVLEKGGIHKDLLFTREPLKD